MRGPGIQLNSSILAEWTKGLGLIPSPEGRDGKERGKNEKERNGQQYLAKSYVKWINKVILPLCLEDRGSRER